MRRLFLATIALGFLSTVSAEAGQRHNNRDAGLLLLGIIAGAVIVDAIEDDNHYYNPEPHSFYRKRSGVYTGPKWSYQGAVWGDASRYEAETGRICPYGGRKDYWPEIDTFVCQVPAR